MYIKLNLLLGFFHMLILQVASAQSILVIKDSITSLPITAAVIQQNKKSIIANADGMAILPASWKDKTVLVSSAGFRSRWIQLINIDTNYCALIADTNRLTGVMVINSRKRKAKKYIIGTLPLGDKSERQNRYADGGASDSAKWLIPFRIDTLSPNNCVLQNLYLPYIKKYGEFKRYGTLEHRDDPDQQAKIRVFIREAIQSGDSLIPGKSLLPCDLTYLVRDYDGTLRVPLAAYKIRPTGTYIFVGMEGLGGVNQRTGKWQAGPMFIFIHKKNHPFLRANGNLPWQTIVPAKSIKRYEGPPMISVEFLCK